MATQDNYFRPMKASSSTDGDLSDITFPVYATPKKDGIRCVIQRGKAKSSTLKPIPNKYIRSKLRNLAPFDGELQTGKTGSFDQRTEGIMREAGTPDFTFFVFDQVPMMRDTGYLERVKWLMAWKKERGDKLPHVKFLLPVKLNNMRELRAYMREQLALGEEGIVIRSGDGPYKYGRSTFKEGYAIKFKPFEDAEAKIYGVFEQMENQNEKQETFLGTSGRSSHKANKKGKNTLGGFHVTTRQWGEFKVGTGQGLDMKLRKLIWSNPKKFIGKIIKFKYQKIGTKDKPRIPIFLGFRDKRDITS
jgi:DNA ligase-1